MRQLLAEDSIYPSDEGFEELRKMRYGDEWIETRIDGSNFIPEKFERDDHDVILHVRSPEGGHSIRGRADYFEMDSQINQLLKYRVLIRGVLLLIVGFAIQFLDAVLIQ